MRTSFLVSSDDPHQDRIGKLDISEHGFQQLIEKIKRAVEAGQEVILSLDFDDTVMFYTLLEAKVKTNKLDMSDPNVLHRFINHHLVQIIARLYLDFGPHLKMEILSARLADEHIGPEHNYMKMATFMPRFLDLVRSVLGNHPHAVCVPSHTAVTKHCMMGWQRIAINRKTPGGSLVPLAYTDHYFRAKGDRRLDPTAEAQADSLLEQYERENPHGQFECTYDHLPKGLFIEHVIETPGKTKKKSFRIHIDDNDVHLDDMKARRLNVETVRVVPSSGEIKVVRRSQAPALPVSSSVSLFSAATLSASTLHVQKEIPEQSKAVSADSSTPRRNPLVQHQLPPRRPPDPPKTMSEQQQKLLNSLLAPIPQSVTQLGTGVLAEQKVGRTPAATSTVDAAKALRANSILTQRRQTPAPAAARQPTPMRRRDDSDPSAVAAPRWR